MVTMVHTCGGVRVLVVRLGDDVTLTENGVSSDHRMGSTTITGTSTLATEAERREIHGRLRALEGVAW